MPTIIPFIPSNVQVPTVTVTLDGTPYTIKVTWNVSAQRYYINVYDNSGAWIITVPLFASPPARDVESVSWDSIRGVLTVQMVAPSLWPVPLSAGGLVTPPGQVIDYTLEGFQPDSYNGLYRALHLSEIIFEIPMVDDPGQVVVLGNVSRLLNMVQSVFQTSSLVYRNGAFEVNP